LTAVTRASRSTHKSAAVVLEQRGVVDHAGERPQHLRAAGRQRTHGRRVGEVAAEGRGATAKRLDRPHRIGRLGGGVAVVDGDVPAVTGQRQCDGPADALCAAGDERHAGAL